jgi:hypothetical protein
LERLEHHEVSSIAEITRDLRLKILTRDKSWFQGLINFYLNYKILKFHFITFVVNFLFFKAQEVNEVSSEQLREALKDINDPMLPVRAHGLIVLRRLVLAKDPLTMKNLPKILSLFQNQLKDEDRYEEI